MSRSKGFVSKSKGGSKGDRFINTKFFCPMRLVLVTERTELSLYTFMFHLAGCWQFGWNLGLNVFNDHRSYTHRWVRSFFIVAYSISYISMHVISYAFHYAFHYCRCSNRMFQKLYVRSLIQLLVMWNVIVFA